MSESWIRAAHISEVPPGTTRVVRLDYRPVLLANWEGHLFAFVAVCPHQRNPLDGAQLWNGQVECPWHHFRYDLRTGENTYPQNVYPLGASDIDQDRLRAEVRPLKTYAVEVRDGEIYVEL